MKYIWVKAIPWDKQIVIDALESGADAVMVEKGRSDEVKKLGLITTIAEDGDLKPGEDVFEVTVTSGADEHKIMSLPNDRPIIIHTTDWTIIPLENLIAKRNNLLLEVSTQEEARTADGILEKGVDGIVVAAANGAMVRQIISDLKQKEERLCLVEAEVSRIRPLDMGDRICIDTCTNMGMGQGILIGNSSAGMFLVHSESVENPYVAPRPFRVNAGPVHAYVRVPEGKTRYLSELRSGDSVLIVDHAGHAHPAVVGRIKAEKRPLLFVEAIAAERTHTLILQNAETIRLTEPGGKPVSVVLLRPGSRVLMYIEQAGRHFGMKVEETIEEK